MVKASLGVRYKGSTMKRLKGYFFSIVIPAYNAERFITRALESVAIQTFDDFEIVIVNDGSTDSTVTRIREFFLHYGNLSWKVINQQNKGIGGARNTGIKNSIGEYIAFLDADDAWYPNKLSLVAGYFREWPEVDFICHDEVWIQQGINRGTVSYGPYKDYKELLFKGNCISTSASVVRRSKLMEAGLFSENLDFNGVEDYELWLRLSKICKIEYLHEVMGEYHIHGTGITNDEEKHVRNSLNVIEDHYNAWPQKDFIHNFLMKKRRSDTLRGAGRSFIKKGEFGSAKKYLLQALFACPLSIKNVVSLIFCYLRIKA